MKKILLTGSKGLVGSHLCKLLTEKNIFVYALTSKKAEKNPDSIHYIEIDFNEDWSTKNLPKDVDAIVHLSQSELFREFPSKALHVFNVNTLSTLKLADYAVENGIKKFIYASSGGVYGTGSTAFKEDIAITTGKNLGFYLNSKLCSEIILESYSNILHVDNLRLFFVYGPGQRKDMLVPRLVNSVISGQTISIGGEKGLAINPIYAEDVALAIYNCFENTTSRTINIAGKEVLTLKDICDKIGNYVGKNPIYNFNNTIPQNIIADIELMKTSLYVPKTDFEKGVKNLISRDFGLDV